MYCLKDSPSLNPFSVNSQTAFTLVASVPSSNRLNLLNLQPLELRRVHLDSTNYYKILNSLSPLTATDYFIIYSPITSTRSNMPSLPLHASSKLPSSFSYWSVDAWNNFPSNIKLLTSLISFKSVILLFDLSAFLKCSFFFNQLCQTVLLSVLLCCI